MHHSLFTLLHPLRMASSTLFCQLPTRCIAPVAPARRTASKAVACVRPARASPALAGSSLALSNRRLHMATASVTRMSATPEVRLGHRWTIERIGFRAAPASSWGCAALDQVPSLARSAAAAAVAEGNHTLSCEGFG
jgi:hypothetical protein